MVRAQELNHMQLELSFLGAQTVRQISDVVHRDHIYIICLEIPSPRQFAVSTDIYLHGMNKQKTPQKVWHNFLPGKNTQRNFTDSQDLFENPGLIAEDRNEVCVLGGGGAITILKCYYNKNLG